MTLLWALMDNAAAAEAIEHQGTMWVAMATHDGPFHFNQIIYIAYILRLFTDIVSEGHPPGAGLT